MTVRENSQQKGEEDEEDLAAHLDQNIHSGKNQQI